MNEARLSLVEHLTDLRRAIIIALTAFAAATAAGYFLAPALFSRLAALMSGAPLVFLGPLDGFYLYIRLAVTAGLILSFPAVVASAAWFVSPGLRREEKRLLAAAGLAAVVLFALGTAYTLLAVLPLAVSFLMSFTTAEMTPFIAVEEYLSFVLSFILYGGLVFELPLFLLVLTRYGVFTPAVIGRQRKLLAGVLTALTLFFSPGGDLVVQLLLAVPLWLLFEGVVFVARLTAKAAPAERSD